MRIETACRMSCLLKRKGDSQTSLKEHLFLSFIICIGRVLCKVTPAMPAWGFSPDPLPLCKITPVILHGVGLKSLRSSYTGLV